MSIRIVLGAVFLLLTACGSEAEVKPASGEPKTQLEKTISTQLDALEKAKDLEQQMLKDAEQRRKQIDAQGG